MARWNGILIWLLVILTPSYSCHCVENSSDLLLSPLYTVGGLPINLSLPLGIPIPGRGARLTPGDPPPPPPPGGPPGGPYPPPGGPPLGKPPPYGLELLDGGSARSGPMARFTATSSSVSMCPVIGSMVPIWACVVIVWLIGTLSMCNISASRMSSCVCGLMMLGNKSIWLGRLLVLDVAGDSALELGVDTLSGARKEPG